MGFWIDEEDVKNFMDIKGTERDGIIKILIPSAQAFIETYCNRTFEKASVVEYFNGPKNILIVKRPPIAASPAPTIYDDTDRVYAASTLIAATDYGIDYDNGIIYLENETFRGFRNVKLTYTGGYDAVPPAIIQACRELVAVKMRQGVQGSLGVASRTMPDGSVVYIETEIPLSIKVVLDGFRLMPV